MALEIPRILLLMLLLSLASSDSSSLARHRRIHSGRRPYRCLVEGCGKSYCRKTTLTKHTRRNHAAVLKSTKNASRAGAISISSNSTPRDSRLDHNMMRYAPTVNIRYAPDHLPVGAGLESLDEDHRGTMSSDFSRPTLSSTLSYTGDTLESSRRSSYEVRSSNALSQPISPMQMHHPMFMNQGDYATHYQYPGSMNGMTQMNGLPPPMPFQFRQERYDTSPIPESETYEGKGNLSQLSTHLGNLSTQYTPSLLETGSYQHYSHSADGSEMQDHEIPFRYGATLSDIHQHQQYSQRPQYHPHLLGEDDNTIANHFQPVIQSNWAE